MSIPNSPFADAQFNQPFRPQKKDNSVWVIVGVLGAVIFIGIAGCLGVVGYFVANVAQDSTETKALASDDGLAEISVPRNWSTPSNLNEEASIQAANLFAENYVVVFSELKEDFADIHGLGQEEIKSYKGYGELIVDSMKMGTPLSSNVDLESFRVNGREAIRYRLTGRVEGLEVVYWLTVIDGKNHYHQVLTWTLKNRESRNEDTLSAVAESFRELR